MGAQEKYIVRERRIQGTYHYTLLEHLGSSPEEIEQEKKRDQIFLKRFDRGGKANERDGIWHVRKPKTMCKDKNRSIPTNKDLHPNVASIIDPEKTIDRKCYLTLGNETSQCRRRGRKGNQRGNKMDAGNTLKREEAREPTAG